MRRAPRATSRLRVRARRARSSPAITRGAMVTKNSSSRPCAASSPASVGPPSATTPGPRAQRRPPRGRRTGRRPRGARARPRAPDRRSSGSTSVGPSRREELLGAADVVGVGHDVELQLRRVRARGTARRSTVPSPTRHAVGLRAQRREHRVVVAVAEPAGHAGHRGAAVDRRDHVEPHERAVGRARLRAARRALRPPTPAWRAGRDRGCASASPYAAAHPSPPR